MWGVGSGEWKEKEKKSWGSFDKIEVIFQRDDGKGKAEAKSKQADRSNNYI